MGITIIVSPHKHPLFHDVKRWSQAGTSGNLQKFKKEKNMQQKRIKSGLAVTESHLNLIDDNLRKARVKSRNEFVEQAVEHYTAFLSAEEHHEQITNMVSADLEKLFSKFAKTFSTNQYKLAVQLSTLCYLTAYQCDYDYEQIHNLMYHCAEEVKELNSVPNFGKILQNVKEK